MKTKGRIRWIVEWVVLSEAGKIRHLDADYETDHDRDNVTHYQRFHTYEDAKTFAKTIDFATCVWGHATIQEEHYLPIEGTVHHDWEPVGEPEYIE